MAAGTFNRRLCVYRLLALFFPKFFNMIKVRMVGKNHDPKVHFDEKLSTKCEGEWVEVGHAKYVGRAIDEVHWPDASK